MLKRAISTVLIVLALLTVAWTATMSAAHAAKKKVRAVAAITKVVKKKKVVQVHLKKVPTVAKKPKRVVKKKPKPKSSTDSVVCLTRLTAGEAGTQSTLGRKAVAYVAMHYAKTVSYRSVCDEARDKERYSYNGDKRNLRTVKNTVGKPWQELKKIAVEIIRNYPRPPLPLLEHATTYLVVADSSKEGKGWIMENTYPLGLCEAPDTQIGDHVFRTERTYAWEKLGVVCPQQNPRRRAQMIASRGAGTIIIPAND